MRRVILIGLSGPAGCGKDALADHLVANYSYEKIRFAHFLYKMITCLPFLEAHRWNDRTWKEAPHPFYGVSPRRLLQTLGTEWGRQLVTESLWVKLAEWAVESRLSKTKFVFPDTRFYNEANWIKDHHGLVVAIHRPDNSLNIKSKTEQSHSSEQFIFKSDVIINNDKDLQALKDRAGELDARAYRKLRAHESPR